MRNSINRKGIQALQNEPMMFAEMGRIGEQVANTARAIAPKHTGHYAASIKSRVMGFRYARARIYVRDFKAFWVEYGAGPSPVRGNKPFLARHVFRRAVEMNGLRWSDKYRGEQ